MWQRDCPGTGPAKAVVIDGAEKQLYCCFVFFSNSAFLPSEYTTPYRTPPLTPEILFISLTPPPSPRASFFLQTQSCNKTDIREVAMLFIGLWRLHRHHSAVRQPAGGTHRGGLCGHQYWLPYRHHLRQVSPAPPPPPPPSPQTLTTHPRSCSPTFFC